MRQVPVGRAARQWLAWLEPAATIVSFSKDSADNPVRFCGGHAATADPDIDAARS